MKTYIFIDQFGIRKSTIKAKNKDEAYNINMGKDRHPSWDKTVFAILEEDLKVFKDNIKRL